jgi:HlyD family secretion protein
MNADVAKNIELGIAQNNEPKKIKNISVTLRVKIIVVVVFLLSVIMYFMRNILLGSPVDVYVVVRGELLQTVVASGRVIWPQRVLIASEVNGRINRIPVIEGQQVKLGQLLIQLEDKDELATLTQATTSLDQSRASLRLLREVSLPAAQQNVNQTEIDFTQLDKQLNRLHQLKQQNFASQTELDTATRNRDVANSKLAAAKLVVKSHLPKGSDTAIALSGLASAQANVQLAQIKLEQDSIRAPEDGTLIHRSAEQGDIVQPGKELMQLAVKGETQIELQIDEKNLGKLDIGQTALASADAFPDLRFNAIVAYINPGIDAARGSVEVKLRVIDPPSYLRQDMTVSVDIETAKKESALVIPTGALRDSNSTTTQDTAPWVLVVRNKRTVHQMVTIGLRGDNNVEILSGLKMGEAVILANVGTIEVDQRVRAHAAIQTESQK